MKLCNPLRAITAACLNNLRSKHELVLELSGALGDRDGQLEAAGRVRSQARSLEKVSAKTYDTVQNC